MKNNLYLVLLILITCTSCEKEFLKEEPRSVLNPTNFYVDEAGLNSGVNAAYASLRPIYGESEVPFRLTTLGTDIFTHGKGTLGLPFNIYNPDLNSTAAEVTELWSNCYRIVNIANNVLTAAPKVSMDQTKKGRLVSECLFIRALAYYWLAQQFGAVPLRLEATEGVITEATRTPQAEIYRAMVKDLLSAEPQLEITYAQPGRITRGAVQHLLSKFYLLLKDWPNAAVYAKKVITEDGYRLEPVFNNIFLHTNQLNKEIIFSVQYENDPANSGTAGNMSHLFFQNSYSDIPGMMRVLMWGRPFSRFAPTNYLMSLFDDLKDSRTDIWRTFEDYYYNNPAALP
ncbi:MAG TPA: RagB/SusD family nutrient uptake outer membrane protein, partial [Chitinophagaceae bacterium]|nr:RagB/SusD family nutrient uptake outer membrane protein [Chitinophagaceae bacterium]